MNDVGVGGGSVVAWVRLELRRRRRVEPGSVVFQPTE